MAIWLFMISERIVSEVRAASECTEVTPGNRRELKYPKLIPLFHFTVRQYRCPFGNLLTMDTDAMLKDIDEEAVIVRTFGAIAIDPSRIDCDYYRFLEMDPAAVNAYAGEYMSQYEWGEFTVGILDQKQ